MHPSTHVLMWKCSHILKVETTSRTPSSLVHDPGGPNHISHALVYSCVSKYPLQIVLHTMVTAIISCFIFLFGFIIQTLLPLKYYLDGYNFGMDRMERSQSSEHEYTYFRLVSNIQVFTKANFAYLSPSQTISAT